MNPDAVQVPEIDRLSLGFEFWDDGGFVRVTYSPYAGETLIRELIGEIRFGHEGNHVFATELDSAATLVVLKQMKSLWQFVEGTASVRQVRIGGQLSDVRPDLISVTINPGHVTPRWGFAESVETIRATPRPIEELPAGQVRLLRSFVTTMTSLAWADLRRRLEMPNHGPSAKSVIFVSYRKGNESFAQAVAERLGREGFVPWYDVWEISAGDSIVGKIGEGLSTCAAFLCVLTADYSKGPWATAEFESALTRAMNDGLRIIPLLLDRSPVPPLLARLRYIDFSDRDPQTFESKMAEVIDGINRLERNPFR